MEEKLMAYCLKTKKKEQMFEAAISLTSRGGYICKGVTADGNKMSVIMSKATAEDAIAKKLATKEY
jgi:hypothetical protein